MTSEITAEWRARAEAWDRRVEALGAERAVYHKKHTAEEFPDVTEMQAQAIWPHLLAAHTLNDRRVLDFGCGHGRWTPSLAVTFGSALGVDPTPAMLDLANAKLLKNLAPGIAYRAYENGRIPVETGSIDVLWMCMVLSTILTESMFAATLEELRRVVHPGSLVCLIDNTSMADGRPVRSPYSISRTIDEYRSAFAPWVDLTVVGDYQDFGEVNTIFLGRVHA